MKTQRLLGVLLHGRDWTNRATRYLTPHQDKKDVAGLAEILIIGAGIAGIACARQLQSAGLSVRLIDKGRGVGGRMATRRVVRDADTLLFDHGAQYLTQGETTDVIARLIPDALGWWDLGTDKTRRVGNPGMSSIPKALAAGLDITQHLRVHRITDETGTVTVQTEDRAFIADQAVITVPAPQIGDLLGAEHPVTRAAGAAVMQPSLTLMAGFPVGSPAPFPSLTLPDAHPLRWIAQNSARPGRRGSPPTWVAQASAAWSRAHLEDDLDLVASRMLDVLCQEIGAAPVAADHAVAHRWRYGLVETPLGQPYLQHGRLYAGGDWCLGATYDAAWTSGCAIAADILAQRERRVQSA